MGRSNSQGLDPRWAQRWGSRQAGDQAARHRRGQRAGMSLEKGSRGECGQDQLLDGHRNGTAGRTPTSGISGMFCLCT